jgi:hypothetical protein
MNLIREAKAVSELIKEAGPLEDFPSYDFREDGSRRTPGYRMSEGDVAIAKELMKEISKLEDTAMKMKIESKTTSTSLSQTKNYDTRGRFAPKPSSRTPTENEFQTSDATSHSGK